MKKVLTIAVVALLATATLFAGVNFGGSFTSGYVLNWNNDGDFAIGAYGSDGINTFDGALNLSVTDDNGFWKLGFDYFREFGAGDAEADLTVNLDKIIAAQFNSDLPVTLSLGLGINGRQTGLRAYADKSGHHFDRIRTAEAGAYKGYAINDDGYKSSFVTLTVGYDKYVKVNGAISPIEITGTDKRSGIVGVLVTPVDGVKVSADYVYNGQLHKGVAGNKTADNLFSVAADVNVQKLADLDFALGASASYAYVDADKAVNQIAATVYGGIDEVSGYVEYAMGKVKDSDAVNFLEVGADLNVVDNLALKAYFGVGDMSEFGDTYFVGGTVGYNLAGIGLELNVEYNAAGKYGYVDDSFAKGFSITPSVSVKF